MEQPAVRARALRTGFTIVEMALVLVISGILVGAALPRVNATLLQEEARRESVQVATQLEYAFAVAERTSAPVSVKYDSASGVLTIARRSGAPLRQMSLRRGSAFGLTAVTFTPQAPVVVFPDGIASSTVTASLGYPGYARTVVASRTGQVRIR